MSIALQPLTRTEVFSMALAQAKVVQSKYFPTVNAGDLAQVATAIAFIESSFRPWVTAGGSSAAGLMQILDGTQKYIEKDLLKIQPRNGDERFKPNYALFLGIGYLAWQVKRYGGDFNKAVFAYNQGSWQREVHSVQDGINYLAKVTREYYRFFPQEKTTVTNRAWF